MPKGVYTRSQEEKERLASQLHRGFNKNKDLIIEKLRKKIKNQYKNGRSAYWKGKLNPYTTQRNKLHNPMKDKEVKEKVRRNSKRNEKISLSKKGDKSHFWRGGIASKRYGFGFARARRFVRLRDKDTCQLCKRNLCNLEVHHIDYNKNNNNTTNLICLCKDCHIRTTNGDRLYYTKLLKDKLINLK